MNSVNFNTQVRMEVGEIVTKPPFQWEISIDCFQNKEVGDFVLSPIFITEGFNGRLGKWHLRFYPKGRDETSNGYSSLFLCNSSENDMNVMYSLAVLDKDNIKVISKKSEKNELIKASLGRGYAKFVLESFITDSKNGVLREQKLRIVCDLIVMESTLEIENKKTLWI